MPPLPPTAGDPVADAGGDDGEAAFADDVTLA
jgi:hypothetical protein